MYDMLYIWVYFARLHFEVTEDYEKSEIYQMLQSDDIELQKLGVALTFDKFRDEEEK